MEYWVDRMTDTWNLVTSFENLFAYSKKSIILDECQFSSSISMSHNNYQYQTDLK